MTLVTNGMAVGSILIPEKPDSASISLIRAKLLGLPLPIAKR
jgi:hypothetical protein